MLLYQHLEIKRKKISSSEEQTSRISASIEQVPAQCMPRVLPMPTHLYTVSFSSRRHTTLVQNRTSCSRQHYDDFFSSWCSLRNFSVLTVVSKWPSFFSAISSTFSNRIMKFSISCGGLYFVGICFKCCFVSVFVVQNFVEIHTRGSE